MSKSEMTVEELDALYANALNNTSMGADVWASAAYDEWPTLSKRLKAGDALRDEAMKVGTQTSYALNAAVAAYDAIKGDAK